MYKGYQVTTTNMVKNYAKWVLLFSNKLFMSGFTKELSQNALQYVPSSLLSLEQVNTSDIFSKD